MYSIAVSTSQTLSNCRAIVLVRDSTLRLRVFASCCSLNHRSPQRAWSSRSGQSWQGWARLRSRNSATPASTPDRAVASLRPERDERPGGGASKPWGLLLWVEVGWRRLGGVRPLASLRRASGDRVGGGGGRQ